MPEIPVEKDQRISDTVAEQEHAAMDTVASGAATQVMPFPYAQLLAFFRRQPLDPSEAARIEAAVKNLPRWRAHLDSVQFLDLEHAAAVQDGIDLQAFSVEAAAQLCLYAAVSAGRVFERVARAPHSIREETRTKWAQHTRDCVYCRRMRRLATARVDAEKAGLPQGEPLLREWLLESCYAGPLQERTEEIIKAFRRKSLPQLVKRLPRERAELVIAKLVKRVPIEDLERIYTRPAAVLEAQIKEALAELPQLYRESVLSEIEHLFQPLPGTSTAKA
jgi:hypothetical protein